MNSILKENVNVYIDDIESVESLDIGLSRKRLSVVEGGAAFNLTGFCSTAASLTRREQDPSGFY